MTEDSGVAVSPFDAIAGDLRALRLDAGAPSFVKLQEVITAQRMERGMEQYVARVPKTTVYDAFRDGRKRVDPQLVGDIVRALGATEEEVDAWVRRCEEARKHVRRAALASGEEMADAQPGEALTHPAPQPSRRYTLFLLGGCVLLSLAGRLLVHVASLPLDLDMTGAAIAAMVLGPWWGAGVGVATSLTGTAISGWNSIPFAVVEVAGALLWGYGVRRYGMGKTIPRFFLLNVIVGVVCTAVAVPVVLALGGYTGNAADQIARHFQPTLHSLVAAILVENTITSIIDKLLSGTLALLVIEALPRSGGSERRPMTPSSPWLAG